MKVFQKSINSKVKNVIIIGAGISGLAAARKLQKNGFNVTILEAKNYIGGRIKADVFNGIKLEMGASWVHGQIDNPVGDIVKKQGGRLVLSNFKPDIYYNKDGQEFHVDKKIIISKFYDKLKAFKNNKNDASVLQVWNMFVKQSLSNEKIYTPKLIANLLHIIKYDFEAEVGDDLSKISAQQWDEDGMLYGGDRLVLGGYKRVTEFLSKGLNIILNTPIKEVKDNVSSVKITTSSLSEYIADYVIVSVPLGVLKNNSISFNPAFPEKKQTAIDTLKLGNFLKTWLVFENNFWTNDESIEFFTNHIFDNFFNPSSVVDHSKNLGGPILLAMHAGKDADEIMKLTNNQIAKRAFDTLKKAYGNKATIPSVYQSSWHNDQYTLGSYSYIPVGGKIDMFDDIAKSYGRIHFAGEHTYGKFHATTHGAYWSGKRAAVEIISKK